MLRIKYFFSYNKRIIAQTLIHAAFIWASLALSYNTFKEHIRKSDDNIFPLELKQAIKATFPLTVIIFTALFIILNIWVAKKEKYISVRRYAVLFIIQAVIVNLIFFSKGSQILIVQNLAIFYLAIILVVLNGIREFTVIDRNGIKEFTVIDRLQEFVPPIVYKLKPRISAMQESFKEKPSSFFVKGFIALMAICAFLSLFKQIKVVRELANIAYFLVVIGAGIEMYKFIRHRERNGRE